MKILILGCYPPPYGGVSIHIERLSRYLINSDNVTVLGSTSTDPKCNFVERWNGRLVDILNKLMSRNYDIIHDHTQYYQFHSIISSILFLLIMIMTRSRWVLTIHDGTYPDRLNNASIIKKVLTRFFFKNVTAIICINDQLKSLVHEYGANPSKIYLIKSFLPIERHLVELPPEVHAFITEHNPVIVSAGAFDKIYNFDLIVQATERIAKHYNNIGLILVDGNFASDSCLQDNVQRFIDEFGLCQNVLILKDVPNPVALTIYDKADLFIRGAFPDGDGISVRECLYLGTPVLATDTGLRPAEVVTYQHDNIDDLVEKIIWILENRTKNSKLETVMKNEAEQNFNKIYELYKKVVSS